MQAFEIAAIQQQRRSHDSPWLEFLRLPSLNMGLYELAAGSTDQQQPHSEDEVYYVVGGRGQFQVDGQNQSVQTGSIIFVAAHVAHHFHTITDDLSVLVFFAPAEYSQAQPNTDDPR